MTLNSVCFFFFQAEDGIRDKLVTGVQTCALPISRTGPQCRLPIRLAGSGDGTAGLSEKSWCDIVACSSPGSAGATFVMLASDGGSPAPRRPAARISGLLASDGGSPAPRCPAARISGLLPSDGGAPAPRRPAARLSGLLASDGGAPAPRRPAARTAGLGGGFGGGAVEAPSDQLRSGRVPAPARGTTIEPGRLGRPTRAAAM